MSAARGSGLLRCRSASILSTSRAMYVSVCEGSRGWLGCLDRADSKDGMDAVDELRVCRGTGPRANAVVDADREVCADAEDEAVAEADADGESGGRERMKSLEDVFR